MPGEEREPRFALEVALARAQEAIAAPPLELGEDEVGRRVRAAVLQRGAVQVQGAQRRQGQRPELAALTDLERDVREVECRLPAPQHEHVATRARRCAKLPSGTHSTSVVRVVRSA